MNIATTFAWHELLTTDAQAATSFYTHVVGWTARDSGMPDVAYTLLLAGDAMAAGLMAQPPQAASSPPGWMGYVEVDDVDAAIARATGAGGTIVMGPMEVPGGAWVIQGLDPQGALFALVGQRANATQG